MTEKVLYITGASSGIGAATAEAAVAAGWKVGLAARSKDKIADLAARLGREHATALPCDVTDPEDQKDALGRILERWGQLDAVFANAGLGASAPGTEKGELENWREMVDVNVWGLLVTARVCIGALKESAGHMVLTGSRAGRAHLKGSVYGATKWFVRGYAENLAQEMEEWGGRCTLISPGMVDTPFFDEAKPDALRPEDVARAVVYAVGQPPHVRVGEVFIAPVRPG